MGKFIDLTGRKFGKLSVVSCLGTIKGNIKWHCKCECGNEVDVFGHNLKKKITTSCGCYKGNTGNHLQLNLVDNTNIKKIKATKTIQKNNRSGVTGVCKFQGRWRALIGFKGKQISLGYYTNKEDAIKARKEAEEKYWKPFLDKIESSKANQ
ncbi:MAG: pathosis-related transcriptional factor/ERF, DNA-binding [Neobacillus sp.]|nr:pathosis-related transcriptional factor/ERF, DNA-binding [Neobacillus sp.]